MRAVVRLARRHCRRKLKVGVMCKANRLAAAILAVLMLVATAPAFGQPDDDRTKTNPSNPAETHDANRAKAASDGTVDGVEFIKHFKIGMTYNEVQAALPKSVEQDTLNYV